jgi:hypothetical protein
LPGRYIEADPEEFVWIGNEQTFPARDGKYELQITEELREVLYLDEAKLVVVDHEPGTEVHSTDKLRPGKPFPRGALMTLHNEHPLQRAEMLRNADWQSAVSPTGSRQVLERFAGCQPATQQTNCLRYDRRLTPVAL